MATHVYIDGANLDRGSRDLGYKIDYQKFFVWLRQKYQADKIYYFIGYVTKYAHIYANLKDIGFMLIFKETLIDAEGKIKGNCDAELVLQSVSDYYEFTTTYNIIITGDGDFRCLINFLIAKELTVTVLVPQKKKYSALIRRSGALITFLEDHYHKFNKKAPDTDASA